MPSLIVTILTSPLAIILLLEITIIILAISSFFVAGKWKRITRLSALTILITLIGFYLVLPYRPVDISPNHPDNEWREGPLVHVLPSVSDDKILLKTSFERSLENPKLVISGENYPGTQLDTEGKFWRFYVENLNPNHSYNLVLVDYQGQNLCDPWSLKTFPSPNKRPENLKILAFTGSGGHDACRTWYGMGQMPLDARKKLLNRALSLNPDVMVGTGDQIYYDLKYGLTSKLMGNSRRAIRINGKFDPEKQVFGTKNENVLKNAVGPQIAYLYGTAARSTPSYFIMDDHDYFSNDVAQEDNEFHLMRMLLLWVDPRSPAGHSFPPSDFRLELGRAAQQLYLPEFLPSDLRPNDLPSTSMDNDPENVCESFGTFRYGKLLEGLFYDVRRYVTLDGENAYFIPPKAENWIKTRMFAENTNYVINFSPHSFGWTAGKWLSWYPDVLTKENGEKTLTTEKDKYLWQKGWFNQHNRILEAAGKMENSTPLFVCGDMHAQAAGKIEKSGNLDFSNDPINTIMTGSLGVDGGGFPSSFRGTKAKPPMDLQVEQTLSSYEKAGFIIMNITSQKVKIDFYGWKFGEDDIEDIENLDPHHTLEISRQK